MQAGGEEGDGDGKGRLLWFCSARRDFGWRDGNVRRDAVEFGLFLDRVLGQRPVGRVYRDCLMAEEPVSRCFTRGLYIAGTYQAEKARHGCGRGLDLALRRRDTEVMRRESARLAALDVVFAVCRRATTREEGAGQLSRCGVTRRCDCLSRWSLGAKRRATSR